eukprot:gene94-94_t
MFDLILAYTSSLDEEKDVNTHGNGKEDRGNVKQIDGDGNNGRNKESKAVRSNLGTSVIFMRDRDGNNCLHLAVIHQLKGMYTHIKARAERILEKQILIAYTNNFLKESPQKLFDLPPLPGYNARKHDGSHSEKDSSAQDLDNGFRTGYAPRERKLRNPEVKSRRDVQFDKWLKEETFRKLEERLLLVLNEDFHSPLTLCAAGLKDSKGTEEEGKKASDMLSFLLSELKSFRWQYGPIRCSLIYLEGIMLPHNYKRYRYGTSKPLPEGGQKQLRGAIEWICIKDDQMSILTPEIKKLIEAKWNGFGSPIFQFRARVHAFMTVLITAMACLVNETPNPKWRYPSELFVTVLYPVVAAMMILYLVTESPSFFRLGTAYWGFRSNVMRGAAKFDKLTLTSVFFSLVVVMVRKYISLRINGLREYRTYYPTGTPSAAPTSASSAHHHQNSVENGIYYPPHIPYIPLEDPTIKLFMAIASVSTWVYFFYFAMGFDDSGPFVLSIYRIMTRDIPYFLQFFLVIVVAFATALSMLVNNGNYHIGWGFWTLLVSIWELIKTTVNVPVSDPILDPSVVPVDLAWVYDVVSTTYSVVANLMMLNLLIAIINNTYAGLLENGRGLLLIEKYNIMCGMEQTLIALERSFPFKYVTRYLNFNSADIAAKFAIRLQEEGKVFVDDPGKAAGTAPSSDVVTNVEGEGEVLEDTFAFEFIDVVEPEEEDTSDIKKTIAGMKVLLLIIDPQIDFHPEGGALGSAEYHPQGSLAVPGANEDSRRIRKMIEENVDYIDDIIITMDSHFSTHIAHAMCWRKGTACSPESPCGDACFEDPNRRCLPPPFTAISHKDIEEGLWMPVDPTYKEWCLKYTKELEKKENLKLTIWPEHCIIGSVGHAVTPDINIAVQKWAKKTKSSVHYVLKGQNCHTEMYSALMAEVEDERDPRTSLNTSLLARINLADRVIVCGQALSHCVNYTLRDILKYSEVEKKSIFLLRDGCSPVYGFEDLAVTITREAEEKGVNITTCSDVFMSIYEHLRRSRPSAVADSGVVSIPVEEEMKDIISSRRSSFVGAAQEL